MTKTPRFQPPTDPMEDALIAAFRWLRDHVNPWLVAVVILSFALSILAMVTS